MKPFLILTLLLAPILASAHRYHQSTLHLKRLPTGDQLQAVLEIDTGDFESVLERDRDMPDHFVLEDLEKEKWATEAALLFLTKHLKFTDGGSDLKLHWFTVEIGRRLTKVYFLVGTKGGAPIRMRGLRVRNTLLFDWNSNQLNFLYVQGQDRFYQTSATKSVQEVVLD